MSHSDLMTEWKERGLFLNSTPEDELAEHLGSGMRSFYVGFDPTADSLHVGNLMPLLAARRLQLAGHRPIILVGGGTGLIGDPSGKVGERTLNSPEVVAACSESLKVQVGRFIDFDEGDTGAILVDNYDWLKSLDAIAFLRDIGKHFSVNMMLGKDSVKSRLDREGGGISYTEFSYMILQAYDYLMLHRRYDSTIQIGGSDQWGNITAGVDLVRRITGEKVHGLTLPLVAKSDGTKFGKTETGTIWLDAAKTTPYEMFQFWRNTSDADVAKFLRFFTFLSPERILELENETLLNPEARLAQSALAAEVTKLVHGDIAYAEALRISAAFFSGCFETLTETEFEQALRGAPHHLRSKIDGGVELVDVLLEAKLTTSRTRARELVAAGSVTVNGVLADDPLVQLTSDGGLFNRFTVIRRGKKTFHVVVWT